MHTRKRNKVHPEKGGSTDLIHPQTEEGTKIIIGKRKVAFPGDERDGKKGQPESLSGGGRPGETGRDENFPYNVYAKTQMERKHLGSQRDRPMSKSHCQARKRKGGKKMKAIIIMNKKSKGNKVAGRNLIVRGFGNRRPAKSERNTTKEGPPKRWPPPKSL